LASFFFCSAALALTVDEKRVIVKRALNGDRDSIYLATADYSASINILPNALAYDKLSRTQSLQRKYDAALASSNSAISLEPSNPFFYMTRATVQWYRKNSPAAINDIEQALAKGSDDPRIRREVDELMAFMGRNDQ
jgi:lipoprotein NlpI